MKVFIGGSIGIKYLDYTVQDEIKKYMNGELEILVGDAYGIDRLVQKYLNDNNYKNVKVYASNGHARNNVGNWQVETISVPSGIYGRDFYTNKDIAMTSDCEFGFMIWDGISKGTLANIERLVKCGKGVNVYISEKHQMISIDAYRDYKNLMEEN